MAVAPVMATASKATPWGAILSGVAGLAGLFGGRRKPTYAENLANEDARKKSLMADRLEAMANAFNPERELKSSMHYAEESAGRAIANSTGELNRRFIADGGNPSGDTAFSAMKRRSQDDILNPLMAFAANQRAQFAQQKMAMLLQAFGGRDGGSPLALQSAAFGASQPKPNLLGSMSMLAGAFGKK